MFHRLSVYIEMSNKPFYLAAQHKYALLCQMFLQGPHSRFILNCHKHHIGLNGAGIAG